MKQISILFLTLASACLPLSAKDVVVWDLGYSLVRPSKSVLQSLIGVTDYLMYGIFDGRSSDELQVIVFDLLEELGGKQEGPTIVLTHTRKPMPAILVEWQTGAQSGAEILEKALTRADEWYDTGRFCSDREYRLIQNALRIMLDDKILAKSMKPIKKAMKLMHELAEAGVEQYILSNWDASSFAKLTEHSACSEIFETIPASHITISGKCSVVKPYPAIYEQFCAQHGLNPEDCIFVDDQEENCQGARAYGMQAIHLQKKDYKAVRTAFVEREILSAD